MIWATQFSSMSCPVGYPWIWWGFYMAHKMCTKDAQIDQITHKINVEGRFSHSLMLIKLICIIWPQFLDIYIKTWTVLLTNSTFVSIYIIWTYLRPCLVIYMLSLLPWCVLTGCIIRIKWCWSLEMSKKINCASSSRIRHIEGILPKGLHLPCISMAGRALLAGYPRYYVIL